MIKLLCRHDWQQVAVTVKPTTFPGNRTNIAVACVSGDYCPKCHSVRTPTRLDLIRWAVR